MTTNKDEKIGNPKKQKHDNLSASEEVLEDENK
jgi:hypothetical protein